MEERENQKRKDAFLYQLDEVRKDTEVIISQPMCLKKDIRIKMGIKSYTRDCPTCELDLKLNCSPNCLLGEKKDCMNRFWHPPMKTPATKKDFQKALEYIEYLIPVLKDLDAFCFSEAFIPSLREFIKHTDSIFKDRYNSPKKKKSRALIPIKYSKEGRNGVF